MSDGPGTDVTSRGAGLARVLLGFYPRAWRARYEEEVAGLVQEQGLGWRGALDLTRGAWDAHRHLGELLGWDLSSRLRRTALSTLGAWVAFAVSACGLAKVWEDPAFSLAGRDHAGLTVAAWLMMGTMVASVVAVGIGALPIATAVIAQAWRKRDRVTFGLLGVLPVAALAFLASGWALGHVHIPAVTRSLDHALFVVWIAFDVGLAMACFLSVRRAVRRTDISARLWRWTGGAALAASSMMVAGGLALVGYVLGLALLAPNLYRSHDGLVATPLPYTLLTIVVVALVAGAWAMSAAAGGWRARRMGSSPV